MDSHAQRRGWEQREYGVGVVSYKDMARYGARDVILAAPSAAAETVAVLARDSLCFRQPRTCVRSYDRMIEFGYEIPGWAIVGFNADSAWAKISLAPSEAAGPVGWVRIQPRIAPAIPWSDILPRHNLFFLTTHDIAFYQSADTTTLVQRDLVKYPRSDRLNYIMHPLSVRGRWMQVELLTPTTMCVFPELRVIPDTLWIQYLTADRRPTVFYYTRGC